MRKGTKKEEKSDWKRRMVPDGIVAWDLSRPKKGRKELKIRKNTKEKKTKGER